MNAIPPPIASPKVWLAIAFLALSSSAALNCVAFKLGALVGSPIPGLLPSEVGAKDVSAVKGCVVGSVGAVGGTESIGNVLGESVVSIIDGKTVGLTGPTIKVGVCVRSGTGVGEVIVGGSVGCCDGWSIDVEL